MVNQFGGDGPSESVISTSSHTHVEHDQHRPHSKALDETTKSSALPAPPLSENRSAIPATDSPNAHLRSNAPSNEHTVTDQRPPPPQCMQDCIQGIESCTANIVRFNERIEANRAQAESQRQENGDPIWIRKATVPLVFIILSWVFLAHVWRLCSRLIEQNPQGAVLGTRREGIGLLVGFVALWLMSMWSYVKVISTGPGLVKDYVPGTDPPVVNQNQYPPHNPSQPPTGPVQLGANPIQIPDSRPPSELYPTSVPPSSSLPYPSYSADLEHFGGYRASSDSMRVLPGSMDPRHSLSAAPEPSENHISRSRISEEAEQHQQQHPGDSSAADVEAQLQTSRSVLQSQHPPSQQNHDVDDDPALAGIVGSMGAAAVAATQGAQEALDIQPAAAAQDAPAHSVTTNPLPAQDDRTAPAGVWSPPERRLQKDPPPLSPAALYCYRCRLVKPPRAHHCRRCGTCVLKMDHHCPWVGGCVGSQNQRFFFVFVFWVTLLEWFTLITTAIYFHRGVQSLKSRDTRSAWKVDGFLISLFPICAMFSIFTTALLFTHIYLLANNMTTIEHMGISKVTSRERVLVDRWFGLQQSSNKQAKKSAPFGDVKAKRQMIKDWDSQWGRLTKEANMWWLGGKDEVDYHTDTGQQTAHNDTNNDGRHQVTEQEKPNQHSNKQSSTRAVKGKSAWKTNMAQALGPSMLLWILPVGKSPNKGLSFPINPRFDPQSGQPRKRKDWPTELQ